MRVFRVFLFVIAAITLPLVLLCVPAGQYRLALANVLIGGSALLWATWGWGWPSAYPAREWLCLALLAAGFAVGGLWIVGIGLLLSSSWSTSRRVGSSGEGWAPSSTSGCGPEEVMPRAEGLVAEFEAEGFRRVGGYRARLPIIRKVVTAAVLTTPERDRFAVATDRVWQVVSRFDHRWLITTSSGVVPLPAHVLRQAIARARPAELARVHRSAVERIAASGTEPDRFEDDAAVLEAAVALEVDAARSVSASPTKTAVGVETRAQVERAAARSRRSQPLAHRRVALFGRARLAVRGGFLLDPGVVQLNHASFGACPVAVFEEYQRLQLELERGPTDFFTRKVARWFWGDEWGPGLLEEARGSLAGSSAPASTTSSSSRTRRPG